MEKKSLFERLCKFDEAFSRAYCNCYGEKIFRKLDGFNGNNFRPSASKCYDWLPIALINDMKWSTTLLNNPNVPRFPYPLYLFLLQLYQRDAIFDEFIHWRYEKYAAPLINVSSMSELSCCFQILYYYFWYLIFVNNIFFMLCDNYYTRRIFVFTDVWCVYVNRFFYLRTLFLILA